MFSLEVSVEFDSRGQANRFFKSIQPELKENFSRNNFSVSQKKEGMVFRFSAQDKTALRASLNSLLKLLELFDEMEKVL